MSAILMGAVFYTSLPQSKKLLLAALADHSQDDGTRCYPGNKRLAVKIGSTERTVRRLLSDLAEEGWVRTKDRKGGRGHAVEWILNADRIHSEARTVMESLRDEDDHDWIKGDSGDPLPEADDTVKGDSGDIKEDIAVSSQPSENHLREISPKTEISPNGRKPNPIWDTLTELFGDPPESRRKLYGRISKYLQSQGADPPEIRRRAALIAQTWDTKALTITSLETHWSRWDAEVGQISDVDVRRFGREQRRRARMLEAEMIDCARSGDA